MARRSVATALTALLVALAGCGGGGDSGSDALKGTPGDDKLTGTAGADKLDGDAGKDVVEGAGGNDEVSGGADEDFVYGGEGDDEFIDDEDDAVDVVECGPGEDLVGKLDTRDEVNPDCERVGWTAKPPSEELYENTINVTPKITPGSVEFTGTCPAACSGEIELRTPRDRKPLGEGSFQLTAGQPGPITAKVQKSGDELLSRGGYIRIVLRSEGINSGFTTFLSKNG